MTIDPDLSPAERDERERLDRLLDRLALGANDAEDADATLASGVRHIHALAEADAATADDAAADELWDRLLRPSPLRVARSATPSRGRPVGITYPSPIASPRPAVGRAVRVVATVAAVLVIVFAALSLSDRLPGQGSTPTVMAAGSPPTTTAEATGAASPDVPATVQSSSRTVSSIPVDPRTTSAPTGTPDV